MRSINGSFLNFLGSLKSGVVAFPQGVIGFDGFYVSVNKGFKEWANINESDNVKKLKESNSFLGTDSIEAHYVNQNSLLFGGVDTLVTLDATLSERGVSTHITVKELVFDKLTKRNQIHFIKYPLSLIFTSHQNILASVLQQMQVPRFINVDKKQLRARVEFNRDDIKVLILVSQGLTPQEIGNVLDVSRHAINRVIARYVAILHTHYPYVVDRFSLRFALIDNHYLSVMIEKLSQPPMSTIIYKSNFRNAS